MENRKIENSTCLLFEQMNETKDKWQVEIELEWIDIGLFVNAS